MELQVLTFHLRFMLDNMEFSTLKDERKIGTIRSTSLNTILHFSIIFFGTFTKFCSKVFRKGNFFYYWYGSFALSDFIFICYYLM